MSHFSQEVSPNCRVTNGSSLLQRFQKFRKSKTDCGVECGRRDLKRVQNIPRWTHVSFSTCRSTWFQMDFIHLIHVEMHVELFFMNAALCYRQILQSTSMVARTMGIHENASQFTHVYYWVKKNRETQVKEMDGHDELKHMCTLGFMFKLKNQIYNEVFMF